MKIRNQVVRRYRKRQHALKRRGADPNQETSEVSHMSSIQTRLHMDLGDFSVWLDAEPLETLISSAVRSYRIYEAMLVRRPGDVWDYVNVVVEGASENIKNRCSSRKFEIKEMVSSEGKPVIEIPFLKFDKLFYSDGWESADVCDSRWLNSRDSEVVRLFAQQLLAMVKQSQRRLNSSSDALVRHEVARIANGSHPCDYMEHVDAIHRVRRSYFCEKKHTPGFYEKLEQLLCDTELASVSYGGSGDFEVMRLMACEQRRRAFRTGHAPQHALRLSAAVNNKVDREVWDCRLGFYEEGLRDGDLFIDVPGSSATIRSMVEINRFSPGRNILSARDQGTIEGFSKLGSGDGWYWYGADTFRSRRYGLESFQGDTSGGCLVMQFGEYGESLFSFDKTLMVIGEHASDKARQVMATVLADWRSTDGDVTTMDLGDCLPFQAKGLGGVMLLPQNASELTEGQLEEWFLSQLRSERPWVDVVIALDVPPWVERVLTERVAYYKNPWKPWVISNCANSQLKPDFVLTGEYAVALEAAGKRAGQINRCEI